MIETRSYVVEETPERCSLVVTGAWSAQAADILARHEVDGLVLDYARGFSERTLEFLDVHWGLRRLKLLDRAIDHHARRSRNSADYGSSLPGGSTRLTSTRSVTMSSYDD